MTLASLPGRPIGSKSYTYRYILLIVWTIVPTFIRIQPNYVLNGVSAKILAKPSEAIFPRSTVAVPQWIDCLQHSRRNSHSAYSVSKILEILWHEFPPCSPIGLMDLKYYCPTGPTYNIGILEKFHTKQLYHARKKFYQKVISLRFKNYYRNSVTFGFFPLSGRIGFKNGFHSAIVWTTLRCFLRI